MLKHKGLLRTIAGQRGLSPWIILYGMFLFFILCPVRLTAQEDYLSIKVVDIGPGDEFFSWWGHLAVMVDNELTGESLCYDFGVFSFDDPHLVRNFFKGDLNYKVVVNSARDELGWYRQNKRDITLYTLNLDQGRKEDIVRALNRSVLPENRNYLYKLFTDNCVTRVIYIIDNALDGKFIERYKNEKGRFTLREHAERHLYRSALMYVLLNFIMGEEVDRPPSKFDEMYLPSEFAAALAGFSYTDPDGNIQPLISNVEKISVAAGRPAVLSKPPPDKLYALFAGLAGAAVFILLIRSGKKHRPFRILLGLLQSLMALYWASAGTLLFYAMFFSHHTYTYNNPNIIYANPLLFAGVPLGILSALTRREDKYILYTRILKALWTYVLMGSLFTVLVRMTGLSPFSGSDNTLNLLLIIPSAAVLGFTQNYGSILRGLFLRNKTPH
jgi:hypothetical protein